MALIISYKSPTSEHQIKPRAITFWILILFILNLGLSTNAKAGNCEVADNNEKLLKENLRKNLPNNQALYQTLLAKHKDNLTTCRQKDPIKTQALWLRLNPQDAKSDNAIDGTLDQIVNQGYNAVIVEMLGNGQILLPVGDNPTSWRSLTAELVKSGEISASYDLWAEVIRKGRERGLRIYGKVSSLKGLNSDTGFVDPYSSQVRLDFSVAIATLLKRQPDGILFDDLSYPPANNVKNLNIYGTASRQALIDSMPPSTRDLMTIYLEAGKITPEAIANLPQNSNLSLKDLALVATTAEQILWEVAKTHTLRGIVVFLNGAIATINDSSGSSSVAIGAMFTPNDQKSSNQKFEASGNLSIWERFPPSIERYPQIYAVCGTGNTGVTIRYTQCVADAVLKVVNANPQAKVCPVLAKSGSGIPSLEIQTQAIRAAVPKISCIAHYGLISPDR